jgi:hypothetical protein
MLTEAEIEDITGERHTPLWLASPRLVTEVQEEADKAVILRSKEFLFRNPNIIPGIYAVEEADYEPGWTGRKASIRLRLKTKAKVTHNGSERPINSWLGEGQLWWWRLHTQALIDAGFPVTRPQPHEAPGEWRERNGPEVLAAFRDMTRRPALVEALMKGIAALGIDVLGQGGEWVIINQSAIDWTRTMVLNGAAEAPPRKKKTVRDRQTDVINAAQEFARARAGYVGLGYERPSAVRMTELAVRTDTDLRGLLGELVRVAGQEGVTIFAPEWLKPRVNGEDVPSSILSDFGFVRIPIGWRRNPPG